MADRPLVAIIVLNWNRWQETVACLEALKRLTYPRREVYVVDNGSTDGSEAALREHDPELRLIQTGANLGWAGGNNAGIRAALADGCDYVLLLNNDAILAADGLDRLVGTAERTPDFGICGCAVVDDGDPPRVTFAGSYVEPRTGMPQGMGAETLAGLQAQGAKEVPYVLGAAVLASRRTIERIGLLDEDMFLNYDETDWCYRARNAGLAVILDPAAVIVHPGGASLGGAWEPLSLYFLARNRLLFAKRHLSWRQRIGVWRAVLWDLQHVAMRYGLGSWWRALLRPHHPCVKSALRGVADYLRGRYGDCPQEIRELHAAFKRRPTTTS